MLLMYECARDCLWCGKPENKNHQGLLRLIKWSWSIVENFMSICSMTMLCYAWAMFLKQQNRYSKWMTFFSLNKYMVYSMFIARTNRTHTFKTHFDYLCNINVLSMVSWIVWFKWIVKTSIQIVICGWSIQHTSTHTSHSKSNMYWRLVVNKFVCDSVKFVSHGSFIAS